MHFSLSLRKFTLMITLPESWQKVIKPELESTYFMQLWDFVQREYQINQCFPPHDAIFSAFHHCALEQVKVVIIGQDPYHGLGQAHGLCFSVNDDVALPPSLKNIFKELANDIKVEMPDGGNLTSWAKQGVLLLNSTLTVRQGQAGSHQRKGWETFTDAVIRKLSDHQENLVFMLWGADAKKKGSVINRSKHLVLEAGHPSPLSANKGHWFGNRHFSTANEYLRLRGKEPIRWA
jgi:uracil-DNA glycosylase